MIGFTATGPLWGTGTLLWPSVMGFGATGTLCLGVIGGYGPVANPPYGVGRADCTRRIALAPGGGGGG